MCMYLGSEIEGAEFDFVRWLSKTEGAADLVVGGCEDVSLSSCAIYAIRARTLRETS